MPLVLSDQRSPYPAAEENDRFLNSKQVRARYADASDMWLWRRLNDESNFPKPLHIENRRFWKLSELVAWERHRAADGKVGA
jgi:predicted DNA-binding transcriptional regulator AlpA